MPDDNDFREQDMPEVLPAPSPPHPGFWGALMWCLGILLVTQLLPAIVGGIIFFLDSANRLKSEKLRDTQDLLNSPEYARAMMWAMLLSQFLSATMAWLVLRLIVGKGWPRILALRWPNWSHLVLVLMGLPGLIVIGMGVDGLAKQVLPSFVDLEQMMGMFGKWPWPMGVLIVGLGPGIGEELWFRGFLGRGLVGRHGFFGGIGLTSLLFGLIHLEPRQVIFAMVIGVLLHLSYLASRSFLVPVVLHAANNSLSILSVNSPLLRNIEAEQIPWYVYGVAVLLVAAVSWAMFKSRTLLVDSSEGDAYPWRPAFPGVEYPPLGTATQVLHQMADGRSWILAIASAVLFAGVVIPTAVEAHQALENQRKAILGKWTRSNGSGHIEFTSNGTYYVIEDYRAKSRSYRLLDRNTMEWEYSQPTGMTETVQVKVEISKNTLVISGARGSSRWSR